ncbi:MAG: tetratricopeptide repeat protein [Acidobacteriaceae bacterium]|nr:tetratricopeptide repeat protein [Acidobacteriaceae bacterium]
MARSLVGRLRTRLDSWLVTGIVLALCPPAFAQIDQDQAKRLSNLGLAQYASHQYVQAEATFRKALSIDKSLFVPNLFLGLDLIELKRPRDAVGYLVAAKTQNPRDPQLWLALGRAYHMLFDPAQSRESYQRATDVAPRNGQAWYGLGVAYLELAESAAAKLIAQFPQSPRITELKAEVSRQSLPHAATPPDQDADALAKNVRAYQRLGVDALQRAGELESDSLRMHALLGDVFQHADLFREAEEEYSKMLTLEPGNVAGLAGLTTAYLHDRHLEQARATAEQALAQDPQDNDFNLLMGEVLVAQHDYAGAEQYLDKSLHARPGLLPRAHALLGRVYARTGRSKQAIAELTQGLSSDDDGSVYYQLARCYQTSGDRKAAAAAFQKSDQIRARRTALAQENLEQK